ncbi:MAG: peptide chain release factor 1 [Clostridiales bacterium]|nr:peptide chain release factor 1 [Clostridiales bacterium]
MPLLDDQMIWMEARYEELGVACSQSEIIQDLPHWQSLMKERAGLEEAVHDWQQYQQLCDELRQARELLSNPEFADLAQEESLELEEQEKKWREKLKLYLIPKDPDNERNVIIEIRAGAGGDEASLFGAVLLRMYSRYAEREGFGVSYLSLTETELGGIKEAVMSLSGKGAFSRMKFESGVHRIQRVPTTESQGRVHTSTATVAVLPEADEVDVTISDNDLRIDTYRASGHGGQHVNKTDSAVRITHLPSGLVVTCQDEKSQLKNIEKAMKVLRSRLYDHLQAQNDASYSQHRKGQIGTGDRSERICTYNCPQGRVTDHRIGLTLYKIDDIMDGDLNELIDALTMEAQGEDMKRLSLE